MTDDFVQSIHQFKTCRYKTERSWLRLDRYCSHPAVGDVLLVQVAYVQGAARLAQQGSYRLHYSRAVGVIYERERSGACHHLCHAVLCIHGAGLAGSVDRLGSQNRLSQ